MDADGSTELHSVTDVVSSDLMTCSSAGSAFFWPFVRDDYVFASMAIAAPSSNYDPFSTQINALELVVYDSTSMHSNSPVY